MGYDGDLSQIISTSFLHTLAVMILGKWEFLASFHGSFGVSLITNPLIDNSMRLLKLGCAR